MAGVPSSSRGSSSAGVTVLSYVPFTSNVTVAGTAAGTATTIVTAAAITGDGSTLVCVEFYAYDVSMAGNASSFIVVGLYEGATEIGRIASASNSSSTVQIDLPVFGRRFITPSAASHTYIIKAYRGTAVTTVNAGDGASGTDNAAPGYVRITSGG
jgi:hypothetical protein